MAFIWKKKYYYQQVSRNKKKRLILEFIIFPEEFSINESKEQKEMFLLLENDDVDGLISFLSVNPTIDIKEELEDDGYYSCLFDYHSSLSHIDFCCLFGSLKCFKYLLLNKCKITKVILVIVNKNYQNIFPQPQNELELHWTKYFGSNPK